MVSDTSEFTFLYHSNEQQWVIAQNSDSNTWNAGLFSRFDWVTVDEQHISARPLSMPPVREARRAGRC